MDTETRTDTVARYDATATDIAERYGVSSRTVRRWCRTAGIPHRRLPGGPRFNLAEVYAWVQKRTETSAAES